MKRIDRTVTRAVDPEAEVWPGHQATDLLEKSREIRERLGWKYDLAVTWLELGDAYAANGSREKAERAFREALGRFRELGTGPVIERTKSRIEGTAPPGPILERSDSQ